MKTLALTTAFVAAGWLLGVAILTLYECELATHDLASASNFDYRAGLISALNFSLPASLVCMIFLVKTSGVNPVGVEVLLLCGAVLTLGVYLTFKAKEQAFPDPTDRTFVEAVWWIPAEEPEDVGYSF